MDLSFVLFCLYILKQFCEVSLKVLVDQLYLKKDPTGLKKKWNP